jgi:hypothetical protein
MEELTKQPFCSKGQIITKGKILDHVKARQSEHETKNPAAQYNRDQLPITYFCHS